MEQNIEVGAINEALEACVYSFREANNASLNFSKEGSRKQTKFKQKKFELNEEDAELEALKLLFSGSNEESDAYRKALLIKRLQLLLESDNRSLRSNASSPK